MLFFIINLFIYLTFTISNIISISQPNSILLVNYTNTTVKINDIAFRESISNKNSLFPIKLNANNYFLQNYNSYSIIEHYNNYQFVSGLTNKIIIPNKNAIFENITFALKTKTHVHIISTFSAKHNTYNSFLKVQLMLNNEILHTDVFNYINTFHYNTEITLPKGEYLLHFKVKAVNGSWCSCPELSNGYLLSRFLAKWEYPFTLRRI